MKKVTALAFITVLLCALWWSLTSYSSFAPINGAKIYTSTFDFWRDGSSAKEAYLAECSETENDKIVQDIVEGFRVKESSESPVIYKLSESKDEILAVEMKSNTATYQSFCRATLFTVDKERCEELNRKAIALAQKCSIKFEL